MAGQQTRVAVITGASSGIGKETARVLAAQGWRVIGVGRDPERSAAAEAGIRVTATAPVTMLRADLSLIADARRVAAEIAALTDRIDVLVNNAGGMAKAIVTTPEGLEQNFAANHLGPFALTEALLPLLRRAAADAPRGSVRIIMTSSNASEFVPGFDWDDVQGLGNTQPGLAYCRGKLANVLFARGLADRLADDGIVAHAMHPGAVDTNFISHADDQSRATILATERRSVEDGADTLIWLATAPEAGGTSGGYFFDRAPRPANPVVDDPAYVSRFWSESEKLVAGAIA